MLYFWSLIIFVKMNFFKLCHFLTGKVQNIRDFNLEGGWSALFYQQQHPEDTRYRDQSNSSSSKQIQRSTDLIYGILRLETAMLLF